MNPPLVVDGVLPPDLAGTFLRIGPGSSSGGAVHGIEVRDGAALAYLTCDSVADANVITHAGVVLALSETGLPQQYSGRLEPEEFSGGLTVPIASHVRRDASSDGRVLFGVEQGAETTQLRIGEWDAAGALARHQSVTLDRATWQHDVGLTARHIVFIESPTEYAPELADLPVPFRWVPGTEGWVGVVDREGDGTAVRWFRLDPCLITHVLGAYDDGEAVVLYVCRYEAPEKGQPFDLDQSVVGPAGIGESRIGGGLPVLERWRIEGERLERNQVDDRAIEYPRMDPTCDGSRFRYGYAVEVAVAIDQGADRRVDHLGLIRFDLERDEAVAWHPGEHRTASEPLFVRADDGRADDEGWLLTVVDDPTRGGTDVYVLDASSFGRRGPQAVIHLPPGVRLPFRSHGAWLST